MNNASTGGRPTKNERREQAREEARELREAARKKEKRNRIFLQSGIIVGILAIAAVVALIIVSSVKPASPGPQNMASDGLLIQAGGEVLRTPALQPGETPAPSPTSSADVIQIQTYVDYMCPYCGQFEATNSGYLRTLIDSGAASLEIFPLAFLDRVSLGTAYPTRAMNAFGCVADQQPDAALDFNELLFANQPGEGTGGLTDDEIVEFARQAGAKSAAVETCIRDQQFKAWTDAATDRATQERGVSATPSIFVNGQIYEGSLTDQATFRQFVAAAQGAQYVEDSAVTPTPTPTPSAG